MLRLVLILSLLLISFTAFSSNVQSQHSYDKKRLAQVEVDEESLDSQNQEATTSATQTVEYNLPYPGMLPDHPLHFLKVIRDKIVGFLISDSAKKTEFNILTSDKRIYAAALLAEKGKYQSSIDTLSESTNYFHEATSSFNKAREEDKDVGSLHDKMENSVKKHLEVVSQRIEPHIPEDMKNSLDREIERLESMENTVNEINPE